MIKLDTILKSFNKTLDQLDKYIAQTDREIEHNEKLMADLQAEAYSARRDRSKAEKTRDKIADLIGSNE